MWAAAIATIRPHGDFPLNDDWDFAIATFDFARTGSFHFTKFTAVSLRAQVLWGAAWVAIFGESFNVLRASTLFLSAAAILVVHRILARLGVDRGLRIFATFALLFHPVFLWSSCTYMTEVPFVFASVVAMYCFVRGGLVAGCLAALVSCFVRQTGVLNLVPPLVVAMQRRRWKDAGIIAAALALFGCIAIVRPEWTTGSAAEFAIHYRVWGESSFRLPQIAEQAYHWFVFNAQNAGLFFAPLVIPLLFTRTKKQWAIAAVVAIVILPRVYSLIAAGHPMPYAANPFCCDIFGGNVFVDSGLGPQSMPGTFPFSMPMAIRTALTFATVVLAAMLIRDIPSVSEGPGGRVARSAGHPPPRSLATLGMTPSLAILLVVASTVALVASGLYVDRYALDSAWALVLVLPFAIPWTSRGARIAGISTLIAVGIFSVLSTAEYFAWNRARWQAFHDLRQRGIAVRDIDGGAEIFDYFELSKGDQRMRRINQYGVPDRQYTIAFSAVPGTRVVASYPWSGWLGLHRSKVVVCAR